MRKIIIPVKNKERSDKYISSYLKESRSIVQNMIENGLVKINGKIINKKKILDLSDILEVTLSSCNTLSLKKEKILINIIFEDNFLLIIDKPKGLSVHPATYKDKGTLVNGLINLNIELSNINGDLRPGIVHRIDKDTSGIIVIAKNNNTHLRLQEQFKKHIVKRIYIALVNGVMKEKAGEIELPLKRDFKDKIKMRVQENGKSAKTYYRVIKKYKNYTLIACKLSTGRTHQIRVHFSYINHALFGDILYGKKINEIKSKGQYLHASILGFFHPITNEYIEFFSPLPKYFKEIIDNLN